MKNNYLKFRKKSFLFLGMLLAMSNSIFAQTANGEAGIQAASDTIFGYFDEVETLIFGIAAIVGLVGAIRVYIAWNNGDQDVNKKIMGWFGACIFIVVVGIVLASFFGV